MSEIVEPDIPLIEAGPFAYANWKAMEAGLPSNGASEYPLYTDAHITGGIEDG